MPPASLGLSEMDGLKVEKGAVVLRVHLDCYQRKVQQPASGNRLPDMITGKLLKVCADQ